ncbi:MAG: MBL fold metallo-hydrolase [Pseudomonadales bacterium]|nr:MBL fold metallo-hydrolase [Pseudomonadales bacterium]
MLLRQLFDYKSYTYSYLLADEKSREAVFIDPVAGQLDYYLQLLNELNLTLKLAVDTHVHADHITALGALREKTGATTYLGKPGDVACADQPLIDGQTLTFGDIKIQVIYTPGHTDDSHSFYIEEADSRYAFTGDTLLIRGSGRTDFQNGSAAQLYDSLHNKLLTLPEDTQVFPGHDYKGWSTSTIGEEKAHNPRLRIDNKDEFITFMNNLKLANPKFMDIAVPANLGCGQK